MKKIYQVDKEMADLEERINTFDILVQGYSKKLRETEEKLKSDFGKGKEVEGKSLQEAQRTSKQRKTESKLLVDTKMEGEKKR